jgi:hypothetical protein
MAHSVKRKARITVFTLCSKSSALAADWNRLPFIVIPAKAGIQLLQ